MLKGLIDESLPIPIGLDQYIDWQLVPTEHLSCPQTIQHADFLVIRSKTRVTSDLVDGSAVQWVFSATSGFDHVDIKGLETQGVKCYVAQGCNTEAVRDYMLATIAYLLTEHTIGPRCKAHVIGCGRIGQKVISMMQILGFDVSYSDPWVPQFGHLKHVPQEQVQGQELVSLHVPLITDGRYPTYHFLDHHFFNRQHQNAVFVNTARGDVVSDDVLKSIKSSQSLCLDVWPHEPNVDLDLLEQCLLATPHIAGYSKQALDKASYLIGQQLIKAYDLPISKMMKRASHMSEDNYSSQITTWEQAVLSWLDLGGLTALYRSQMKNNQSFNQIRAQYPRRSSLESIDCLRSGLFYHHKTLLAKLLA